MRYPIPDRWSFVVFIGFMALLGLVLGLVLGWVVGLIIVEVGGRHVPTKAAIDIINFAPDHPRSVEAKMECVLKPGIYLDLVNQFADAGVLPSNETLKPELISDKGFVPKAVDGFLDDFRKSLEYAGLLEGSSLKLSHKAERSGGPSRSDEEPVIVNGDYVQWTSNGIDQFHKPLKVVGIDGEWVFVEGTKTGIPMKELSVMDPPGGHDEVKPPKNPFHGRQDVDPDEGRGSVAKERFTLDEGPVVIHWPGEIGKHSVLELESLLSVFMGRLKRKAGLETQKAT